MEAFEKKVRESFGQQRFMATIGAELTTVKRGAVEIKMPFDLKLTQQNSFLHAGAITSILDSACGYAALSVASEHAEVLSVEFKVNLLAPAVGDFFVARASVKRAGKKLTICTADAFAVNGREEKVVAIMLATIMNMGPERA
ncbi:MAG: PaaI family thioesterase [Terriglobales bacterium]